MEGNIDRRGILTIVDGIGNTGVKDENGGEGWSKEGEWMEGVGEETGNDKWGWKVGDDGGGISLLTILFWVTDTVSEDKNGRKILVGWVWTCASTVILLHVVCIEVDEVMNEFSIVFPRVASEDVEVLGWIVLCSSLRRRLVLLLLIYLLIFLYSRLNLSCDHLLSSAQFLNPTKM